MPDESKSEDTQGAGGDSEQTVSMAEYKKLQRTLARTQAKTKSLEQSLAQSGSTGDRTEELLANVVHMFTLDDEARAKRASELLPAMKAKRDLDMSSAQVKAELGRLADGADMDANDERLSEAQRLIEEMARTGNPALGQEALRRAEEAVKDTGSAEGNTDVEDLIQAAILKDRQDHGRVDTGKTTAPATGTVTRDDLRSLDPRKQGIEAMRETVNKALDQIGQ